MPVPRSGLVCDALYYPTVLSFEQLEDVVLVSGDFVKPTAYLATP